MESEGKPSSLVAASQGIDPLSSPLLHGELPGPRTAPDYTLSVVRRALRSFQNLKAGRLERAVA